MNDVYEELDHVLSKHNIKEFACRPVERGYAFDDVPDAPAEGTYMKVAYSFSRKCGGLVGCGDFCKLRNFSLPLLEPPLPSDINGKTFSNIFGANTNALELLILKRRLMGPCWITISNAEVSNVNVRRETQTVIFTPKFLKPPFYFSILDILVQS